MTEWIERRDPHDCQVSDVRTKDWLHAVKITGTGPRHADVRRVSEMPWRTVNVRVGKREDELSSVCSSLSATCVVTEFSLIRVEERF